jgi:DNA-binding IclR family transcriptional regulator
LILLQLCDNVVQSKASLNAETWVRRRRWNWGLVITSNTETKRPPVKITSLNRGLKILDVLAGEREGLGVTEISRRVIADKGVVHRTLSLLMLHDYVDQDPISKKYVLGFKIMELAGKRLRSIDLFSTAKPVLKDIVRQTGEIVVLAVMIGDVLAYLDQEEGPQAVHISTGLGQPVPLHSTASGKVILAYMPEQELTRLFREKGLPAITDKTITSFLDLKAHLAEVRVQGYAVDDQETYPGVRCVAAAIRNHRGSIVASLSISGPTQRITVANITVFAALAIAGAAKISARLGYVENAHIHDQRPEVEIRPSL